MKFVPQYVFLLLCVTLLGSQIAYADDPPVVTCSQIQQYQGVSEGDRVRVIGICTCETGRFGYSVTIIADPVGGPWAALYLYDANERLAAERGDTVEVVGIVQEYYELTELSMSDETEFPPLVTGTGPLPPVLELTTGTAADEPYECCIIRLFNVEVQTNPDEYGNIAIDDGTGEFTLLQSIAHPVPAIGHLYDCLTGVNYFHFGEFKIRPRDLLDYECPALPTATATPDCIHDGDVNAQITFLIAIYQHSPTYQEACSADCNGDANVTAGDAQGIFMQALGMFKCVDVP